MRDDASHNTYSRDGVDVEAEASFSSFAGSICKASYGNSPFVEVHDLSGGGFRGPRPFTLTNVPEGSLLEASSDGIGTKGILIDAAKTHHLAAYDLVAMTASDITRYGGVPLVFINILDVAAVGEPDSETNKAYKDVLRGLGEVAGKARIVLLKGETAQMGASLGSEVPESPTRLNWSGVMIGAYHKDKMITGEALAPGQAVVALKEDGFRCNGISSVRAALRERFGNEWWGNTDAEDAIRRAAAPSVLYDVFLAAVHGWYADDFAPEIRMHAIAHLSGGAFREKLGRDILFPSGLSAALDDLWDPPEIMRECASWRGIGDEELYEVWNGGQGMLVVVDEPDAERFIARATEFSIQAKVAGSITRESSPRITIDSKLTDGKRVVYT